MRLWRRSALCLIAIPVAVGAQPAVASVAPSSWVGEQAPDCGTVVGRLLRRASDFDASDNSLVPLANAWVAVGDSGATAQARYRGDRPGALTDTAGVFRLQLPPNRMTVLEVKALGYAPMLIALDGARYRAMVVEVMPGSIGFHVAHRGISVVTSRGIPACAP